MLQTKEQDKMSEKELNETELDKLHDKEFKVMIIKMLTGLQRRMEELGEDLNEERENIIITDEECNK